MTPPPQIREPATPDTSALEVEVARLRAENEELREQVRRSVAASGEVAERTRAQARLERLTSLIESTSDLVVTADRQGRLIYMNSAGRELLGLPPEVNAEERNICEFLTPETVRLFEQIASPHAIEHRTWRGEVSLRRMDGTELVVSLVLIPASNASGVVEHFSCIARDMSEERRREAELAESNARYEAIANATSEVVWDWEVVTDRLHWSRNVSLLLGADASEMPTMGDCLARIHPDDRRRVDERMRAALQGQEQRWSDEYRFRKADGAWIWIADQGAILRSADGLATRFVGSMSDVTDRKALQARLLLTERLAALGTMAAGVAHEINNPLAYVLANLGFVVDELKELRRKAAAAESSFIDEALQALGEAREGAERVRGIVRDLKAFSRTEEETREPIDLRPVLESAINIAHNQFRHRARLSRELGEVPLVNANAGRLGQVFLNLLTNAAHSIPEGETARHEVRVRAFTDSSGRAVVEVEDTGCGIPAEIRGKLFDPFFTTKPVGEGTGLGLPICHGIVQSMGGAIEFESEVGRGSSFRVVLPAAMIGRREPAQHSPGTRGEVRGRRLMVIDDEPLIGRSVQRCLRAHEVIVFTSAEQALQRLRAGEQFDLVFCDLMMPGMSGMDFHQAITVEFESLLPRIVFLTGGAFTPRAVKFLQTVPNERVEKPFRAETLEELVERLATSPVC